ncbi:MAG: GAF domain-containing protein [Anaerolineae bacterium]|nr:GAF domain-containing protein [Anaerolineae bacterium]
MVDRFQHLFDSLAEKVVVVDRDLRITYANPAWVRCFGQPDTPIIGRLCPGAVQAGDSCPMAQCPAQRVFETGQPLTFWCAAPAVPNHLVSASPMLDDAGQVVEVVQVHHPPLPTIAPEHTYRDTATALRQTELTTTSGQGLGAVLDTLLDQLGRVLSYDSASIFIPGPRSGSEPPSTWHILAGSGFPASVDLSTITLGADDKKLAWLLENRAPLIIDDVHNDPKWSSFAGLEYIRSWLGAPLISQGRVIGILNLDRAIPGFYTKAHADQVMTFANQAAIVVENARLLEAERTRSGQLRLLRDLSQRILSILDPSALLEYATAAIQQEFGYYHVDVFLIDTTGEFVTFQASSHPANAARWRKDGLQFQVGSECITGHVAATGRPYVSGNVKEDPLYLQDTLLTETLSEMAVPIKVGQRVVGVIDVNSDRLDAFDEQDLYIAQSLADLLALGLENARLYAAANRRVTELEVVRGASLSLTSSLDLQEVLEAILEASLSLIPDAQNAHVFLYQPATAGEENQLTFGAARWADGKTGTPWATPREGGLTQTVARSGQTIVVPDMRTHPLFQNAPQEWQGAIIGLPLRIGQRVVGVMSIAYHHPYTVPDTELHAIELLADQAAIAVENARLFASEHQARIRLESIQTIAIALGTELNLDILRDKIVVEAAHAFQAEAVSLMQWDDTEETLSIRAGYGLSPAYVEQQRIQRDRAEQIIAAFDGLEPIYIDSLPERPIGEVDLIRQENLYSILIVPLFLPNRFVGALNIYSKGYRRTFGSAEMDLAKAFAAHAAVAIENAQLFAAEARRRREAETLQAATQALSKTLGLQQIFEVILNQLREVVPYDSATVQRLVGQRLQIIGGHGFPNLDDLLNLSFDITTTDNPNCLVIEHRAPLILEDAPALYSNFGQEPHAQAQVRSWLGVPLLFGDRLIGMLALDKREPGFYTEEHARLALAFAAQAAIAIENARLYQESQQRLREMALLFDANAALSTSLDMDKVAVITAQHITTALEAQGCAISLWYPDQDELITLLDYSSKPLEWQGEKPGTVYRIEHYPASQHVLTRREPLAVQADDPIADPEECRWMVQQGVASVLMVPMVVRDKVVGLLELMETEHPRDFTATEISLCQTLANQAAAALDNARLFRETETRAREMAALASVSQALMTLELDDVLDNIAHNALRAVHAEIASVYLLDEERQILVPRSVHGMGSAELEQALFQLGEGTIGQTAASGEPLIVSDTTKSTVFTPKSTLAQKIKNTLTVPLIVKKEVIGTLEMCNKIGEGGFTIADRDLLGAFAAQAAAAIDNARLYQQVSHHLEAVQIVNKVAQAITSTLDFDLMVRRAVDALVGTRHFERVNILMVDEEQQELWLHPALASGTRPSGRGGMRIPLDQGITGWVATTGQLARVTNVDKDPRYLRGYPDTLAEICVPLRAGVRTIGVLDVQSTHVDAFAEDDERLLSTVAGQLSTAIENARLFIETRQRVRELTALMQVSQALNEAQGLDTILDIVLGEAFILIGSGEGSVILIDPPGSNRLRIVAARGLDQEVVAAFNNRPVYTHEGTYRRTLQTGQIVEVTDTSRDDDFLTDVGSRAASITNIPLVTDKGPIGLIAVDGLPGDETTRRLLTTLAGMAAVAIDKERLHQETAHRLSEVSTLYTLATQITTSLAMTAVLDSIVAILRMTLDCRSCSIFLIDPTGEYLQSEAASGPAAAWRGIARLKVGEGISGRVVSERRSIYVPNTAIEPDFIFFDPQIRSLLVVPLVVRNKAIGTLSIDDTKPHAFDEELRLLTIAAAQAAVAIENAQLYESLQKSYGDLEQAYEELRELDKMKSELIQNISHELRTPLTFIKGYVELLLDGEMGQISDDQQMALDIVSNKADALSKLVDDIISMQQAGREQLQLEPLSMDEMAATAVRSARVTAQELGILLTKEEGGEEPSPPEAAPLVLADRRRLGQVFDNLLQNAIKFSNPGGSIVVRVHYEGESVRVEVADTGIGIPKDQLARIFERFYQVDGTTTRRVGGTGLGLAIVKQIVENHGGQVGVESELNKGSVFYFTLPVI